MPWTFNPNISGKNDAAIIVTLVNFLKNTGMWTCPSFGNSLDSYTTNGSTPSEANMNRSNSWVIIQQPNSGSGNYAGTRQILFWKYADTGSYKSYWKILYSHSAGFTGGTPSGTNPPTATDQVYLLGSSGTAYNNFVQLFPDESATPVRWQMGIDNSGAAFYCIGYISGTGNNSRCLSTAIVLDSMDSNTVPIEDLDPYVLYSSYISNVTSSSSALHVSNLISTNGGGRCWFKKGTGSQAFQNVLTPGFEDLNSSKYFPRGVGVNPHNGKEDLFPVMWARLGSSFPGGYKGISSVFKWIGSDRLSGDLLNVTMPGDHVVFDDVALKWDNISIIP